MRTDDAIDLYGEWLCVFSRSGRVLTALGNGKFRDNSSVVYSAFSISSTVFCPLIRTVDQKEISLRLRCIHMPKRNENSENHKLGNIFRFVSKVSMLKLADRAEN